LAPDIRHADAAAIAAALGELRAHTLRLFAAWRTLLPPSMDVRYAPELNPPRWELGHLAWFEERWIARNPARLRGAAADPDAGRAAPLRPAVDALYDSSHVAHTRRWHLDLPDADATLAYAAQVRQRSLALLADLPAGDDALYFPRWALLHEAMHAEASVYMAQHLALDLSPALARSRPAASDLGGDWALPGGPFSLGHAGPGFAFDNELGAHEVDLAPFAIARAPVTWREVLAFVEAGGYDDERLWSSQGWAWRRRQGAARPGTLAQDDGTWRRAAFGHWLDLLPTEPAVHLTQHEALAWCRWAGRRLPTEAEWECAAITAQASGEAFAWGEVWEWTASTFAPYPGFQPHPYRDYSMPWFDGRPVLRGASFATWPALRNPRYRNYFPAERNDIFAGFRTCAA